MAFIRALLLAALLGVLVSGQVARAEGPSKEQVEAISRMVFAKIDQAKLPDGKRIGKEKAATLEYPLLPYDLREMIIVRGGISGMAEVCSLDWLDNNFRPLMMAMRADGKFDQYQLAYADMLHGAAMTGGIAAMKKRPPCSDEMRAQLESIMMLRDEGEKQGAAPGQTESRQE